jgi:hypothetical protein
MPRPLASTSGPTLTVATDAGSPGSSVFDLPTQSAGVPAERSSQTHSLLKQVAANASELSTASSFVVISGGTGGNAICSAFGSNACYVLPVSDDGGSSSEIIRVLGGPSVCARALILEQRFNSRTRLGTSARGWCVSYRTHRPRRHCTRSARSSRTACRHTTPSVRLATNGATSSRVGARCGPVFRTTAKRRYAVGRRAPHVFDCLISSRISRLL